MLLGLVVGVSYQPMTRQRGKVKKKVKTKRNGASRLVKYRGSGKGGTNEEVGSSSCHRAIDTFGLRNELVLKMGNVWDGG